MNAWESLAQHIDNLCMYALLERDMKTFAERNALRIRLGLEPISEPDLPELGAVPEYLAHDIAIAALRAYDNMMKLTGGDIEQSARAYDAVIKAHRE